MQLRERDRNRDCRPMAVRQADFMPIGELLLKQTKGKVQLSREEKLRLQKYANAKRKERN